MTSELQFTHIYGDKENARLDVIFIHGLTGDPMETWQCSDENGFWPKWLEEKFPDISVYAVGYPSSIFEKWAKKEMNLHERAENLTEHLASSGIGKRPLAMITHSLGGILAKEVIKVCNESGDADWHNISKQIKLAVFMATPHKGAALAATIKMVAPRISTQLVQALSNDSGYLTSLNKSYRDLAAANGIATVSYFEKYKTKASVLVVSEDSADPGVGTTRPVGVDADHISICKPANRDALIYLSVCRHIEKVRVVAPMPAGLNGRELAADDYSQASDTDRRTLLQKLIDAGREHEYQKANDLQSKFARKYYKLGLYTDAKSNNDAVLSAVEQRFITHVFNPKICGGASDDDIAAALQVNVIDPITSSSSLGNPSPSSVLQALYFLTEQCYLQWDKP